MTRFGILDWGLGIGQHGFVAVLSLVLCASGPVTAVPADSLVSTAELLPARALATAPNPKSPIPDPKSANPHGNISIPCQACHTPEAWTPLRDDIDFDHSEQTRFAMTGKHTLAECGSCHLELRFDQPDLTADECASCHLDVHRGQLGDECQMCHNTQDFQLTNGALIHAQTSFPLTGSHLQISCETCHTEDSDGLFAPLDTDCFACHAVDYQTAASIDHVAAGFSTDCEQCHSTLAFSAAGGFNHVVVSEGFALVGTHAEIACESCHTVPGFEPIFDAAGQDDCYACHRADYERTTTIDHVAAGFPTECQQCHSVTVWENAMFEHVAVSGGFALVGAHVSLPCSSCHVGPDFEVPTDPAGQNDCFACHAPEHEEEHPNFPTDCLQCHNINTWEDADFEHTAVADGFALVGAHATLDCASCHVGPDFDTIFDPDGQNDCFACHAEEHQDEHPSFPTNCLECHNVNTWDDADFNHVTVSEGFALVGAHAALDCAACHVGPDFEPIFDASGQNDCFACHAPEHQEEHPGFPTECLQCHTVDTWDDADFDHVAASEGFALIGAHATLACASCHTGPDFEPIYDADGQNDCFACHAPEHEEEHPAFPTDCLQCHNVNTWDDATFDHAVVTGGFALVGAHASLDCASCHIGPDFEVIFDADGQNDCFACHAEEHEDEHPNFPTNCLECHTVDTWDDANFDHAVVTGGFALVGAHETLPCSSCHVGPDFEVIFDADDQNDCFACHAPEHQEEHPAFPTDCLQCHNVNTWDGAVFNHNTATDFDLVGAHVSLPCASCHVGPDFDLIFEPSNQNDCFACHAEEHQDEHPSFPTNCLQCHNVDTWDGAEFDHDPFFPIYSGRHEGTWDSCQTCHNQGTFATFTCLVCHEHNREDMDDDHDEVGGYVYESNACLSCHPDGEDNVGGTLE